MIWRQAAKSVFTALLFLSVGMGQAHAGSRSAVTQDMRGFGDDQFARMTAGAKARSRVPTLAAIYETERRKAPATSQGEGRFAALESQLAIGDGASGGALPSGMPLSQLRLSSTFGLRLHPILGGYRVHKGVDLAASAGSPIRATADGLVSRAGLAGGYGLTVKLRHAGGVETRYAHMERIAVEPGQRVRKGQTIGYVGSTGRSTGPHLHYEVLVRGRAVNPMSYLAR